jgi:hypothetical protein
VKGKRSNAIWERRYCVTVRDDEGIICEVWKLQWTVSYFCWSPIWTIIRLHRDKNMLLSYDIANTYIALDGHVELDCHKAIPPKQQSSSRICRTTLIHYSDWANQSVLAACNAEKQHIQFVLLLDLPDRGLNSGSTTLKVSTTQLLYL